MKQYDLDRLRLFKCFDETVKTYFDFLKQKQYMFCKIREGHIVYSSLMVNIEIYYERISFEIYLEITLKKQNISCSIDEIIKSQHFLQWKRVYTSATTEKTICKSVSEIAEILQSIGSKYIDGDIEAFRIVQTKKNAEHNVLLLKKRLSDAEKRATLSWRNKDYAEVIKAYNPIYEYLTPTQRRKLEYCIREQSTNNPS